MDIMDRSVTTEKGNRYVVDCFSRWTEACPLSNKTAVAVADAFFHLIICHYDQGREFENHLMQELCLRLGLIKPVGLHIIWLVMGWLNDLTAHCS